MMLQENSFFIFIGIYMGYVKWKRRYEIWWLFNEYVYNRPYSKDDRYVLSLSLILRSLYHYLAMPIVIWMLSILGKNFSWQHFSICTASVAQLDAPSDWRPGGRGFNPRRGRQHSFVEIDREIFSRSFSPFRWYKKGSCQFLAKECAQYWLTA